jgi:tRNA1(Val) A37 N6-methylase TrmN6
VTLELTENRFLNARVIAAQPKKGFRSGHDTVLLAAAVPAKRGDRVLELGSGAGIASLCLAARVPECRILGIEIDAELVGVATRNAQRNPALTRVRFTEGDVLNARFQAGQFDHVFFNPPFHPDTGQASPYPERDRAMRGDAIAEWTRRAIFWSAAHGTVTAIVRADRAHEMEPEAAGLAMIVLPMLPRTGSVPTRAIVQIRKGEAESLRTVVGFPVHETDGRPTPEADEVLRHAKPIVF